MAISPDWAALAPTLLLGLTAFALFVFDSIAPDTENHRLLSATAVAGSSLAALVAGAFLVGGVGDPAVTLYDAQLVVDGMALFFTVIFTSVTALIALASHDYLEGLDYQAEYFILVVLAAIGMTLMASANSLATVFVSLELASLPSYALVAYLKQNRGSVEAGLKYFLVGALSSAIFAYGVSLVYGATGSLKLGTIAAALSGGVELPALLGVGILMVTGGFAFKTASVPFHFWAPEAYEGAPAPVSAFLSSASKAAGFAVAFRVFVVAFDVEAVLATAIDWVLLFQILALATMFLGNFAAATQENVKRMLAYSSIGQAGYVLIGLAALTSNADQGLVLGAGMLHLFVYGFMNTGAFLFVALAEYWGVGRTFADYNGLGTQAPMACAAMTVFLFSLAGLPVGGGFLSKYFLLMGTIDGAVVWLGVALAINSALSLYYYSRVVKAMWIEDPDGTVVVDSYPAALYAAVIIAAVVTVALLPALGLFSGIATDAAAALAPL